MRRLDPADGVQCPLCESGAAICVRAIPPSLWRAPALEFTCGDVVRYPNLRPDGCGYVWRRRNLTEAKVVFRDPKERNW